MESVFIIILASVIAFLAGGLIYQFEIIKRQRKELAHHLTDHIDPPETILPTEVAGLQELVRKYAQLLAYKDEDWRGAVKRLMVAEEARLAAEEELKKKDAQIRELMTDNMDYIIQRDNAIKQLEELRAEIAKQP